MKKFTLYTDGGARGNPGPAAAGVVIYDAKGDELDQFSSFLGTATNNQAEYQALILGLGRVLKLINDDHTASETRVVAYLDSELIVQQLIGAYRVKSRELKPLFAKVEELAAKFHQVEFKHIRREQNTVADSLVNEELDKHA
jgi:ribonuclease HI